MEQGIQAKENNFLESERNIKQFQSIYYLLKGKRDTDIKLFDDNKKFSYADILELNEKINNKLELHRNITNIVNVTVGLDNKEIKSFGNWNEFKNTDWNISAKTKYIILEWDFNMVLPNQLHNVPQTHTVRVRIGNNLKPSEMIQVVFEGGEEYDLDEVQSEMVCKIDFVNAQICSELKLVVSEWYDSLPSNEDEQKLVRFIRRNVDKIQTLVIFFFLTAGVLLSNILFSYLSKSINPGVNQNLFLFMTWNIPLIYLFYSFGSFYMERIHIKTIHKLKRNPMFGLTKGDENKLKEISYSNRKLLKRLSFEVLLSLGVNFITYAIGFILHKL